MTEMEARNLNTAALAFMGDAVYDKAVREKILNEGAGRVDALHKKAVRYVSAKAQAKAIKGMFDGLSETEQALVKRARNHRYHSKAKNADPMTYKWASAFEALIGYLYLAGEDERLSSIIDQAFERIDETG